MRLAPLRRSLPLVVGGVAVSLLLLAAGAPTPTLFGGVLTAAVLALYDRSAPSAWPRLVALSQATVGVTVGSYVRPSTLAGVTAHWLPIASTSLMTLLLSLLCGTLLARRPDVDRATGAFAMIAGGASGLTAIARDLGTDERMVAVIQYLRVVLVVTTTPLLAHLLFAQGHALAPTHAKGAHLAASAAFLLGCLAMGLLVSTRLSLPAGTLLLPLAASTAATLAGAGYGDPLASVMQDLALLVLGVQIGARFTRSSLRTARGALPLALTLIVFVMTCCAGLGILLATETGRSPLEGYLATTPGGLYVVLTTATSTGADLAFVVSVQVFRLVAMLLLAPLIAKILKRRDRKHHRSPRTGNATSRL